MNANVILKDHFGIDPKTPGITVTQFFYNDDEEFQFLLSKVLSMFNLNHMGNLIGLVFNPIEGKRISERGHWFMELRSVKKVVVPGFQGKFYAIYQK